MPELQSAPDTTAGALVAKLTALVEAANRGASRIMAGWDRSVGLQIDGRPFAIVTRSGQASLVEGGSAATSVSFTLSEQTLALLIKKQETPLGAKLKGLIQSSGSIFDILRFSSLLSAAVQQMGAGSQ